MTDTTFKIVSIIVSIFMTISTGLLIVIWYVIKQFIKNQKETVQSFRNELRTLSNKIVKNDSETLNLSNNYQKLMNNFQKRLDAHSARLSELLTTAVRLGEKIENIKEGFAKHTEDCKNRHLRS